MQLKIVGSSIIDKLRLQYSEGTKEKGVVMIAKKRFLAMICIMVVFFLTSGCAHYVTFKKPYAYTHKETIHSKAAFYMDESEKIKMHEERSAMSGMANRWDVPIGIMVHDYAVAYLNKNFTTFVEEDTLNLASDPEILIRLTDLEYYIAVQAAHCMLTLTVEDISGKELFKKRYSKEGPSAFARVFWGGVFAQKSAIRDSTHEALEKIFKEFIEDVYKVYSDWPI